jgi:hypothetical protein
MKFCIYSAVVLFVLVFAGCGGSKSSTAQTGSAAQGLPQPVAPGQFNSYVGSQGPGDVWTISLDHSAHSFNAADVTAGNSAKAGLFASAGGFLSLSQTNTTPPFQAAGFVLENLGRSALARMGDLSNSVIPMVQQQGTCMQFKGNVTFQFVVLPNATWARDTDIAYGSVQAATNANTWTFSSLQQFTLTSAAINGGAALSPGVCTQSLEGFVISVPPSATVTNTETIAVGPTGFFVENAGSANLGTLGVIQPSAPVNTASVVGAHYLGFIYEPGGKKMGLPVTQTASFGCAASDPVCTVSPSGTTMTGGSFPLDNPGGVANKDTTIDLGPQDSMNNGLYKSAKLTIPDDAGVCSTTGSCTVPAVAVVGNPENKFAVFLVAQDTVNNLPIAIYLLQQDK